MEPNPDSGVRSGTHSAALGQPLIAMGGLLHPLEGHASRAADITCALSAVQADLALLRAEILVLRVAISTQLEHSSQLTAQVVAMRDETMDVLARVQAERMEFSEYLIRVTEMHGTAHRMIDILTRMVADIPSTYAGARLWRWLKHFWSSHGV